MFRKIYPKPVLFWCHFFFGAAVTWMAYAPREDYSPTVFISIWFMTFLVAWVLLQIYNNDRQPVQSEIVFWFRAFLLVSLPFILAFISSQKEFPEHDVGMNILMAVAMVFIGYMLVLVVSILFSATYECNIAFNKYKRTN